MIATAWNDGKHATSGAGYGLRISKADRDRHFRRDWRSVAVELPDKDRPVKVELTASFWKNCTELRHREIGQWLRANGFDPWPKGHPPKFGLEPTEEKCFRLVAEGVR